jgi:hypothetical protein
LPAAPHFRRSRATLVAVLAASALAGATLACGSGDGPTGSVGGNATLAVAITPGGLTMFVGDTTSFRFYYTANDSTIGDAVWTSTDTTRLVVIRRGLVLAKAATPGKYVCATVATNSALQACASVVVQ